MPLPIVRLAAPNSLRSSAEYLNWTSEDFTPCSGIGYHIQHLHYFQYTQLISAGFITMAYRRFKMETFYQPQYKLEKAVNELDRESDHPMQGTSRARLR